MAPAHQLGRQLAGVVAEGTAGVRGQVQATVVVAVAVAGLLLPDLVVEEVDGALQQVAVLLLGGEEATLVPLPLLLLGGVQVEATLVLLLLLDGVRVETALVVGEVVAEAGAEEGGGVRKGRRTDGIHSCVSQFSLPLFPALSRRWPGYDSCPTSSLLIIIVIPFAPLHAPRIQPLQSE